MGKYINDRYYSNKEKGGASAHVIATKVEYDTEVGKINKYKYNVTSGAREHQRVG